MIFSVVQKDDIKQRGSLSIGGVVGLTTWQRTLRFPNDTPPAHLYIHKRLRRLANLLLGTTWKDCSSSLGKTKGFPFVTLVEGDDDTGASHGVAVRNYFGRRR